MNGFDSKGGSGYDDVISISSSTCTNAKKLNNGNKQRSNNRKMVKSFGSVRSFRRRAKIRSTQSSAAVSGDAAGSNYDSSPVLPNYLKATSSSKGKKGHLHSSSRHTESTFDSIDRNDSPSSRSSLASLYGSKPLQTLSRTSSIRNKRFLVKRSSFKPKRSVVGKATYSSTVKNLKFAEPVEILNESEKISAMKVCRYHHCSLHGHSHGPHEPDPQPKRFPYRRRWSMKKQKSLKSKSELWSSVKQSSDKKNNHSENQISALDQESISSSVASSEVEDNNAVDSYIEVFDKQEPQLFSNTNEASATQLDLIEVAFGETSFPERSYQENLNILRKYSLEEGGSNFGLNGCCSRCSCHIGEQVITSPKRADAMGTSLSHDLEKANEQGSAFVEDNASLVCANEALNDSLPETSATMNSVFSSPSDSQISSRSNSDEEGDTKIKSIPAGDSKVVQSIDSGTNSPILTLGGLQFSKQRHVSMWHLIHQHMSTNLAADPRENPLLNSDDKSPLESEITVLEKESSPSDMDTYAGTVNDEVERKEIELRKSLAIKLVREAIEKILLPEVQDQASDGQSVTSENTPRSEIIEIDERRVFVHGHCGDSDAAVGRDNFPSNLKGGLETDDASSSEIKTTKKKFASISENKAPKHWSNLKKWILLQRFIKALEKVRKFNPRKPRYLSLNPDPEAEKINLQPPTIDKRKSAEEWMLDYALRQAVSQLAPTQKKKVSLLVKAFETVVPAQEETQVTPQLKTPMLKDNNSLNDISSTSQKLNEYVPEGHGRDKVEASISDEVSIFGSENQENGINSNSSESSENAGVPTNAAGPSSHSSAANLNLEVSVAEETERDGMPLQDLQEDGASDGTVERKNHIKMWHMIYRHVVSDIAEKVGSQLLGGAEDDEADNDKKLFVPNIGDHSNALSKSTGASSMKGGFTKSDALKLIKDAVDEILLHDSFDTQSLTSESISDQDLLERNSTEIGGQNVPDKGAILINHGMIDKPDDAKEESQVIKKSERSKSKNWSKLKKLILLKRSIKALEKARNLKTKPHQLPLQAPDPEPDKIDLRRQLMDERKKAEQWMLDYAVQHIVSKLTPDRKRRVSMLVEAFEAVVPLPET